MNLATRPAGTRPRSVTSMPCALAHSRTPVLSATPAGGDRAGLAAAHRPRRYSRGDAVAEPTLRSSARDGPAVSACLAAISPYDTRCPPSIT